jgi:N-acetylglutamate synthase-like GNAT family acetyltransferase
MEITPCEYGKIAHFKGMGNPNQSHVYERKRKIDWYCCEKDGTVIGSIGLLTMGKRTVRIRGLFVLPNFRRQGYGAAMIKYAVETAKNKGYANIMADTSHRALFKSLGFVETSIEYKSFGGTRMVRQL